MNKAAESSTTEKEQARVEKARRLFFSTLFDLSWRMAAALLVPTFVGIWADEKWKMNNIGTMLGLGTGLAGAMAVVVRNTKKLQANLDDK